MGRTFISTRFYVLSCLVGVSLRGGDGGGVGIAGMRGDGGDLIVNVDLGSITV